MEFRIADTFTDSLTRLSGQEQKAVKTTAFDLQLDPANPGMQLHKLDRAKDPNFWSIRVSRDIRLIVHRTKGSFLLCYVDHHDDAYTWAERRKLETHPRTGAAQLVEIRETIKEITVPKYVEVEEEAPPKPALFHGTEEQALLDYGVPSEWIEDVLGATEDNLLELVEHLPAEAAEALLDLATGVTPTPQPAPAIEDPFEHPDAQRRFRVMQNVEELERALEFPWEKWTVFLHPAQRDLAERTYSGPARVSGSAGTGKTIVALHRAVHLARANPDSRVLLATFSETLANSLQTKLKRLISNEPRLGDRLEVHSMDSIGERLYEANFGSLCLAPRETIERHLSQSAEQEQDHRFSPHFLWTEWDQVIDAWQIDSWEAYRDVKRLGRKTRLPETRRKILWAMFDRVRKALAEESLITHSGMFSRLADNIWESKHPAFEHAVIDEAQDIGVQQLRFLASLSSGRPDSLFFTGDLGQRIFQQPFSWKSLGVEIRGRSKTLRVNYRTSHQIRMQADRLLAPELGDVDGNAESRRGTVSVFNGPPPLIKILESEEQEIEVAQKWVQERLSEDLAPHEIGVFVRSPAQLSRARAAIERCPVKHRILDERMQSASGRLSVGTMHLAKGLEFRAVAVMACDDEVIPSQDRIETVVDDSDLEEVYDTERHLLYVACTRARDHLLVTAVDPASEFLDDLRTRVRGIQREI